MVAYLRTKLYLSVPGWPRWAYGSYNDELPKWSTMNTWSPCDAPYCRRSVKTRPSHVLCPLVGNHIPKLVIFLKLDLRFEALTACTLVWRCSTSFWSMWEFVRSGTTIVHLIHTRDAQWGWGGQASWVFPHTKLANSVNFGFWIVDSIKVWKEDLENHQFCSRTSNNWHKNLV